MDVKKILPDIEHLGFNIPFLVWEVLVIKSYGVVGMLPKRAFIKYIDVVNCLLYF